MAEVGATFKPGEKVPHSGIYDVVHDPVHAQRHQVTCVYDDRFPPCNHCGDHVRFRLAVKAIHVTHNDNFLKKK
jgi:hypothetical protein